MERAENLVRLGPQAPDQPRARSVRVGPVPERVQRRPEALCPGLAAAEVQDDVVGMLIQPVHGANGPKAKPQHLHAARLHQSAVRAELRLRREQRRPVAVKHARQADLRGRGAILAWLTQLIDGCSTSVVLAPSCQHGGQWVRARGGWPRAGHANSDVRPSRPQNLGRV